MLNNFIYAKSKAMFEERLAEVPTEAIVFIEDTKEIWNHGHYFAGESIDPELLGQIQTSIQELKANVDDNPFEKGDVEHSAVLKGGNNQTTSECEVALGKYNVSNYDTQFSIGIGTSEDDRKNAFEVKQNGDIYIEGVEGRIQDKLDKLVNITYSELKTLRNNSKLIPGQHYRITDYVTTTAQSNTQSAGHQFDIIVTADDVNVLNENARAIQHEGNSYFSNSDLNAWELKYCLDNDTNRFNWADAENGKGVIYRMIDEWNNDCPYDFKNIQFARWELSNPVGYRNDYDFDNWEDNWVEKTTPFDSLKTGFYGLNGSTKEFSYGCNEDDGYYKYKVEYTISESPTYCYTFGKDTDYSISGRNYGNVIKEYKDSNKILLNNIVFLSENCYSNSFGNNCNSNSFGSDCYSNSFGDNCNSNSFGSDCYSNSFGNNCSSNSFGNNCSYNSFGNNCYSNSLGNECYSNSFGNDCGSNSFGNNCSYNSFGNDCGSNSFGTYCSSNSFGNGCRDNSFGNYCYSNSLGDSCQANSFESNCRINSFGNNCYENSFGADCVCNGFGLSCSNNSFGEKCNNNSLGENCDINSFGNNCNNNSFAAECSRNSFEANCNNNSFMSKCNNNSLGPNCNNNSFAASCQGNSFGASCVNNGLGEECNGNSFGADCSYNIFVVACNGNMFGESCIENRFEVGCDGNSFGRGCNGNSFGGSCSYNIFGNGCFDNSFGEYCYSNSFGNTCNSNSFGADCENNSFGNTCNSNSFGNGCIYNSFGLRCQNNSFRSSASQTASLKNYVQYNHFDDTCSYNVIWNSSTVSNTVLLKNINVNRGVSGKSSAYNYINIDTLNADYEIKVAKNSSGEIKIYCEADLIA